MTLANSTGTDLLVKDLEGGVRLLSFNRPESHNAFNKGIRDGMRDAIGSAERDGVRVFVITGAGDRAFSVGADLKDSSTHASEDVSDSIEMFIPTPGRDVMPRTRLPVIAAVHGYCCGAGWELALAADILLCSESAAFWFPQTGLGLFPGAGGTSRLVKAVGKSRAMEIVMTGRRVMGQEAVDIGFASSVYPDKEALEAAAIELATTIASKGPLGVAFAKQSILRGMDLRVDDALMEDELRLFPLYGTHDRKEASAAFLERRDPVFEGR